MSVTTVNEGTSSWLTVSFKDKAGALAAPVAVNYRIDCLTTDTMVRDWTPVGTPLSVVEIALTSDDNDIITPANPVETRRVTIEAIYGIGDTDKATSEYDYVVRNLTGIT